MHILLKYPTRNRPIKFMNNLNAYLDKASGKHKITIVVTMDIDDSSMNFNNDPRLEAKGREGFKTLITLPVIGRKLYDRFGYIYHPAYKSEWCDNEQTEVFEELGVLRHIDRRPIVHRWAENQDALMQRNMQIGASVDREVYQHRKTINFNLGVK